MTCQIINFVDKKRERDERRQPQAGCFWLLAVGGCVLVYVSLAFTVTHVLPLFHPFGLRPPD